MKCKTCAHWIGDGLFFFPFFLVLKWKCSCADWKPKAAFTALTLTLPLTLSHVNVIAICSLHADSSVLTLFYSAGFDVKLFFPHQ